MAFIPVILDADDAPYFPGPNKMVSNTTVDAETVERVQGEPVYDIASVVVEFSFDKTNVGSFN